MPKPKLDNAIKRARKHADTLRAIGEKRKTRTGKVYSKEGLLKSVTRKLKELYYGPKTYLPKKRKKKKDVTTVRTRATVKVGLKQAGLTDKEIKRLRGIK